MAETFWDNSGWPIAIAHRGAAGLYRLDRHRQENTHKVFKAAHDIGYEYLELDVISTADGKVIVMHVTTDWFEALLHKPSAPNAKRTGRLTHAELKTRLRRKIPTLGEIFKQFPRTKFLIDSKTDEVVEPLAREIIKAKAYDRVFLNSFYLHRIERFQQLLGDKVTYGLIIGRYPRYLNRKLLSLVRGKYANAGLTAVVLPYRFAHKHLVDIIHQDGWKAIIWTANTRPRIERTISLGADGIISDNAQLLKEVLAGHRD